MKHLYLSYGDFILLSTIQWLNIRYAFLLKVTALPLELALNSSSVCGMARRTFHPYQSSCAVYEQYKTISRDITVGWSVAKPY